MKLYRRHTAKCKKGFSSRSDDKCSCPFWLDLRGEGGKRVPLGVREVARAMKLAATRLEELEARPGMIRQRITIEEAIEKYHSAHPERAAETVRKYRRILAGLAGFLEDRAIKFIDEVRPLDMVDFRAHRDLNGWTWLKEVEILKGFFRFMVQAECLAKSPAEILKRPPEPEDNGVVPYFANEIVRIIAACAEIGTSDYERRRARGMILTLRFTGMRISDVITLSRDDIRRNYIEKRLVKNHKRVKIEIHAPLRDALEALPEPRGSVPGNRMFFWNQKESLRSALKGASRTLAAVFRKAGVERAHSHKFRHTLASELLAKRATIEEVASILGDSPRIVERHYSKWIPERQAQQDKLLREVHGTKMAHTEIETPPC